MADEAWLKNLAVARYSGGAWVHPDPAAVRQLAETRLAQALAELEAEAEEYAEAFTQLARGRRALRVLPLSLTAGPEVAAAEPRRGGFLLLLGRCQVSVEFHPPCLIATLYTVRGFERLAHPLHRFEPQADAFGSLAWRMDNSLIMTGELIIKRLFEDITRAACEAGDLAGS